MRSSRRHGFGGRACRAALASTPKPATPPAAPRRAAAQVRTRPRRLRSQRSPAGRPLPFRRRHLAREYADPRGSLQLRLVHHPRRPGAGRGEAAHRRGLHAGESPDRLRCAEGRRLLSRLHGYRAGREPRARAAAGRAGAHRRHRDRRATWRATSAIRSASGVAQPFAWFSSPDNGNSTVYLGALYQNGLTMPDRDYYLSPDEKYATLPREVRRVRRADAGARRRARSAGRRPRASRRSRPASPTTSGPRFRTAIR